LRLGLVAVVIFLFATLTILSVTMESSDITAATAEKLDDVTAMQQTTADTSWGPFNFVKTGWDYFSSLYSMITWNYAFLDNAPGTYFKWIVGSPISGVVVLGLIVTFLVIFSKVF